MAFYENTILARQDLAEKELKDITNKYKDLINNSSGKTIKIEEWGLLNLANKINNFKKLFSSIINLRVMQNFKRDSK